MNSTAIATIHLSALQHNVALIKQLFPQQKILAMVKSNAYGHGLIPIVRAMTVADAFGVATIAEALQLRQADIDRDFIVMRGFTTPEELAVFFNDERLIACIHTEEQVALLEALQKSQSNASSTMPQHAARHKGMLRIWLKIDTGMHRLGISVEQFENIYQRLNALPFIDKSFIVCSHLADADNPDKTFTQTQIDLFNTITRNIPNKKSLLNSAGIIAHSNAHYDWIRPGLLLFGISPFTSPNSHQKILQQFRPVMTLASKLIAVKTIAAGEKIGYSCTYTAEKPMKIGIIGMGYGDSYPRHAKNGTPVLIRGERCPIVGRVSMDMISVDVTHLKAVNINDTVTLWDDNLLVSEIAQYVNTVPHELICHLTGRVQTRYV